MPEHDSEQELGPKITSAFQNKADDARGLRNRGLAGEARRRVRKRRQSMVMAAAAVLVVVGIGGVWNRMDLTPDSASSASSDSKEGAATGVPNIAPSRGPTVACPPDHPILKGGVDLPAGTGLDVNTPVQGLQACRYRLTPGATMLLGQQHFDASVAQQVVNAIKVLPERNPDLPVFKCAPPTARPSEAIVLRFTTAAGIREIWVQYDGCDSAGFFTGSRTFGLYSAPLKLFMTGTVRPTRGTYLDALTDW